MDEEKYIENIIKETLEELYKLTTTIYQIYEFLIDNELKRKKRSYYESLKAILISSLSSWKKKEDEIYSYFQKNYERANIALDIMDRYNRTTDHKEALIRSRIYEKLTRISIIDGINSEYDENKDDILQTDECQMLIEMGYSEEDAIFFYLDYYRVLDNSICTRYASLLEDEIASNPKSEMFIRMRFEESFASPSDLENTLIKYHFNSLPKSLDDELKPPYSFSKEAILSFIRIQISDNFNDIINKMNYTQDEHELESCIMLFKTYLLYIKESDLKLVIGRLASSVKDENLSERLTEIAYSYKQLQKSQNKDNNYQLS